MALGATRGHVIVAVTNDGDTIVELDPAGTAYEVRDGGGDIVTMGRFTYPMPGTIAPGETAWFVDTLAAIFVEPQGDWTVSVEPRFTATKRPIRHYSVAGVSWDVGPDGALVASGRVTNDTDQAATQPIIAVILLDRRGRPLAGLYDLTDAAMLGPGETRTFETDYPGAPPTEADAVAEIMAFAYEAE